LPLAAIKILRVVAILAGRGGRAQLHHDVGGRHGAHHVAILARRGGRAQRRAASPFFSQSATVLRSSPGAVAGRSEMRG